MPSVIWQNQPQSTYLWENSLNNRINFGWEISKYWSFDAGMRNRLIAGNESLINPQSISYDNAWADLSWNWFECNKMVLNTAFDRLFVTFEKNKWQLRLGRQRINWGQTFVWNPNDIFNTYSFFDFDYPERPGSDALRLTYYHSETSSSELAASVNRDNKFTAAIMHHWNKNNFDFQLIGGLYSQSDIVLGGACTSDFKGLNFRGEFSLFQPVKNISDTISTVAASFGLDYIFSNSLTLQAEVLYNNISDVILTKGLMALYSAPLSSKFLSICDWNIFMQASYPITPRLNASISAMFFADIKSYYSGLSLDYSIIENFDFSFIMQYFSTAPNKTLGNMQFALGFARLIYSF
jgi:hypothetical protein